MWQECFISPCSFVRRQNSGSAEHRSDVVCLMLCFIHAASEYVDQHPGHGEINEQWKWNSASWRRCEFFLSEYFLDCAPDFQFILICNAVWPEIRLVTISAILFTWQLLLGLPIYIARRRRVSRMDWRSSCCRCNNGLERFADGSDTALC